MFEFWWKELPFAMPEAVYSYAAACYFLAAALPIVAWLWTDEGTDAWDCDRGASRARRFRRRAGWFLWRLFFCVLLATVGGGIQLAAFALRVSAMPAWLAVFGSLPPPGLFAALVLAAAVALFRIGPEALWDFLKR